MKYFDVAPSWAFHGKRIAHFAEQSYNDVNRIDLLNIKDLGDIKA